jgi:tetratricopeptide (TPR) repeat protein
MKDRIQTIAYSLMLALMGSMQPTLGDEVEALAFPELQGPYLGQPGPGLSAEMFAPGIISTELPDDDAPAFSPDGREVFFRTCGNRDGGLMCVIFLMRQENGVWSHPEIAPFSGRYMDSGVSFAPDGKRLYFASNRPTDDGDEDDDGNIWYLERLDRDWSEPILLASTINSAEDDLYPAVLADGTIYWNQQPFDGEFYFRPYRSRVEGSRFTAAEPVDDSVVSGQESGAYSFSPEEDYVVFTATQPGSSFDLHVSFKQEDGSWGAARSLGTYVNSRWSDKFSGISPDGKYMFFVSRREHENVSPRRIWNLAFFDGPQNPRPLDVYWVDTRIIHYAKTHDLDLAAQIHEVAAERDRRAVAEEYRRLEEVHSGYYLFSEDLLDRVATLLLGENKLDRALDVFDLNAELFPDYDTVILRMKLAVLSGNAESFRKLATGLSRKGLERGEYTEAGLNSLGYYFLELSKFKEAVTVFKSIVDLVPDSANAYDSLGEAYRESGDLRRSIESYRRSLELDPGNANAREVLRSMSDSDGAA